MAKKSTNQELLAKLGPTLKIKIDPEQLTGDHIDYRQVAEIEIVDLVSSEEEEEEEDESPQTFVFQNPFFQTGTIFQTFTKPEIKESPPEPQQSNSERATSFLSSLTNEGLLELAKKNLEL